MRWHSSLFVLALAASALAQSPADTDYSADENVLKSQGLPIKGAELLQILRERTPRPETIAAFKKHVARLGAGVFAERIQATNDLLKMGAVVRPLLEKLLQETNADLETIRRLRHLLEQFPADKDFAIMSAAARLIQRDKPADSVKVLLEFVPYATNEYVRQDVQRALNAAAASEKKQLLLTLKDPEGARRAAAAEALIRAFGADAKTDIEPLMTDEHLLVGYQVGMALVEKRDKSGLPLLIKTIASAPAERAEFALELLYRVAGDTAPTDPYPGRANAEKFSAVWNKWHEKHEAKLDLSKLEERTYLGFTVISTSVGTLKGKNRIFELGPNNTVRWEFDGPRNALGLQVLGPNRLLIAEFYDRRVTERDFKGNVLWQHAVVNPIACQRLPNGHTFIATRQLLLIVDGAGREVFTHNLAPVNGIISAATRLRNGNFVVVTSGGRCQMLDATGRELKAFQLGQIYSLGGNVEILPNGRVLAPLYANNMVAEFDWNGNKVWSANLTGRPISVTRLSNGNTLVTHMINLAINGPHRVIELDPNGREVWSYQTDSRAFRAVRR